jgi:hypothetical protein
MSHHCTADDDSDIYRMHCKFLSYSVYLLWSRQRDVTVERGEMWLACAVIARLRVRSLCSGTVYSAVSYVNWAICK